MTRADEGEGREPGQDDLATRFALEERTALVGDLSDLQACLSVDGRAHSAEIIARAVVALTAADDRAAQAEAEVARLRTEKDSLEAQLNVTWAAWGSACDVAEAANLQLLKDESTVSALRERVATLEAALQPFATYAADMPGADFGEGEIGEYYHEGFRRSIRTQDLRAARTALEAPHEDN